jgi:hypothetical protein
MTLRAPVTAVAAAVHTGACVPIRVLSHRAAVIDQLATAAASSSHANFSFAAALRLGTCSLGTSRDS